jgi:lipid A 4'-phosphatase
VNRTALIVVLLIAVGTGFVFAFYPKIDLSVARAVYETTIVSHSAAGRFLFLTASILRKIGMWIEILLIVLPIIPLVVKFARPQTKMFIPGSAILFLATSVIVGPGLLVNVGLKSHWERPRPGHLLQFGGNQHFIPWWQPIGDCRKNCSFVSGEASSAFWTVAPAALTPPQWRPLAYAAAVTFGTIMSLSRIVMNGHFLSDTIFAGVFTFLVIWFLYAAIYRWKGTQLDDDMIEKAIERCSVYCSTVCRRFLRWERYGSD